MKVGDKVRVLQKDFFNIAEKVGAILEVKEIHEDSFSTTSTHHGFWVFPINCFEQGGLELIQERVKVFEQAHKPEANQPVINAVIEFPIEPRAFLAGMAMQGMLANPASKGISHEDLAAASVIYTDALLGQLKSDHSSSPPPDQL